MRENMLDLAINHYQLVNRPRAPIREVEYLVALAEREKDPEEAQNPPNTCRQIIRRTGLSFDQIYDLAQWIKADANPAPPEPGSFIYCAGDGEAYCGRCLPAEIFPFYPLDDRCDFCIESHVRKWNPKRKRTEFRKRFGVEMSSGGDTQSQQTNNVEPADVEDLPSVEDWAKRLIAEVGGWDSIIPNLARQIRDNWSDPSGAAENLKILKDLMKQVRDYQAQSADKIEIDDMTPEELDAFICASLQRHMEAAESSGVRKRVQELIAKYEASAA